MIPEVYRGVRFRQVTPALRWYVGDGFANMKESEFPKNAKGEYINPPPEPVYVTFEEDAHSIDIDRLLRPGGGLEIDDTNQRRGERAERAAVTRVAESLSPAAPTAPEGGGE